MKYNPTYLGEIELTEETLVHYGVKGMRWRNRKGKTKASLRSDRPRSRKRNITGKGSGAQVHKDDLSYKKLNNFGAAVSNEKEKRKLKKVGRR